MQMHPPCQRVSQRFRGLPNGVTENSASQIRVRNGCAV